MIVLLDGDEAGDDARRAIRKGGAYRKPLVPDELVLQLNQTDLVGLTSNRPAGPVDLEDLIPIELAVRAVERYATQFAGLAPFSPPLEPSGGQLDEGVLDGAVGILNAGAAEPMQVAKLGFARSVLDELSDGDAGSTAFPAAVLDRLDDNFRVLFQRLNSMRRTAVRQHDEVQLAERTARVRDAFLDDHPTLIRKVDVHDLIEELELVLDDSPEAEDTRADLRRLRAEHSLDVDPGSAVGDVDTLRIDLIALQYGGRRRSQEGTTENRAGKQTDRTGA